MGFERSSKSLIWVISDTHLRKGQILPESFVENIRREDCIFHLGDFISLDVIEFLNGKCRFEGVVGNCDAPDIRRIMPSKKIVEIEGKKIGLIHGRGGSHESEELAKSEFSGRVDIALFGHTHIAKTYQDNGTVYLNPGSLTDGRGENTSFGLLHLDDHPWTEIIQL